MGIGFGWLDAIIIVLALICLVISYKLGIIRVILLALLLYAAVIVSAQYGDDFTRFLMSTFSFLGNESLATLVANVAIYVGAIVLAFIVSVVIQAVLKIVLLGWIDKLGGIVLGVGLAVVAFSALLITIVSSDFNVLGISCDLISRSISTSYIFHNVFTPIWNGTGFLHGILPQELVVDRIDLIVEGNGVATGLCPSSN